MGASSVTGISGNGAVRGMKGPGNNRNFWVSNVCPHILAVGETEITYQRNLVGNSTIVVFPQPLEKGADSYVVIATAVEIEGESEFTSIRITKTETDDKMTGFNVVTVGDIDTISWVLINKGWGIEATVPDAR